MYARGAGNDFESGGTCADTALLKTSAIYMTEPQADGTLLASMLVSDGFARVTSNGLDSVLRNNVVIAHGASQIVHLSGSVSSERIDLGPQAPAGTVPTTSSTTSAPTSTVATP